MDDTESPWWRAVITLPLGLGSGVFASLCVSFVACTWSKFRRRLSVTTELQVTLVAACSVLGSFAYDLVVANPTRYALSIGLEKSFGNLTEAYGSLHRAVTGQPAYGFIVFSYALLMLLLVLLRTGRRHRHGVQND